MRVSSVVKNCLSGIKVHFGFLRWLAVWFNLHMTLNNSRVRREDVKNDAGDQDWSPWICFLSHKPLSGFYNRCKGHNGFRRYNRQETDHHVCKIAHEQHAAVYEWAILQPDAKLDPVYVGKTETCPDGFTTILQTVRIDRIISIIV